MRGYFYGLVPYTLNFLCSNTSFYGEPDVEITHRIGKYWFFISLLLWNPLNILIVRMQNIDYPLRKFRHAFADMLKHEPIRMFYKGLVPIMMGQIYLHSALSLAEYAKIKMHQYKIKYADYTFPLFFLMGCLVAHPFYLLGMKVQNGPFH